MQGVCSINELQLNELKNLLSEVIRQIHEKDVWAILFQNKK